MKSQSHKSLLLISFISLVIAALAYGYMNKSVGISSSNIEDMRTRIKSEDDVRAQARALLALSTDTASDRAKLRALALPSDKVVNLIVAVEAISSESGSKVTIANIGSPDSGQESTSTASSSASMVNMNVTATGSWTSVMRALVLAENLPYVSNIDSVRLDLMDKQGWELNFKLHALTI